VGSNDYANVLYTVYPYGQPSVQLSLSIFMGRVAQLVVAHASLLLLSTVLLSKLPYGFFLKFSTSLLIKDYYCTLQVFFNFEFWTSSELKSPLSSLSSDFLNIRSTSSSYLSSYLDVFVAYLRV
jgi:hypothetical protein